MIFKFGVRHDTQVKNTAINTQNTVDGQEVNTSPSAVNNQRLIELENLHNLHHTFFVHFFAAWDHCMISTLEESTYISKVNERE